MGVMAGGTLYDALFNGANQLDLRYSQEMLNIVQRNPQGVAIIGLRFGLFRDGNGSTI